MSVILILLTASLTIAIGFLIAFIWSVKNGQYEDDYTPSVRMLFDEISDKNEISRQGRSGLSELLPAKPQQVKKQSGLPEERVATARPHEEKLITKNEDPSLHGETPK